MDEQTRHKVEANLFPASHRAVAPWDAFRWHLGRNGACDAWRPHSSQALAIDVFGCLKMIGQSECDLVLDAVARRLGLPTGGPWEVELEWLDDANRMRERRRTQVDAVARGRRSLIFFECKFTEGDGGPCSQTRPLPEGAHKGLVQCTGTYTLQTNPTNGRTAPCALSGKAIRYWEIIPKVFRFDAEKDYERCPFAGPWFQWMRNLTLCWAVARAEGLKPGLAIAYADSAELPFPRVLESPDWACFTSALRPGSVAFMTMSHRALLELAGSTASAADAPAKIWDDLRAWVDRKIERVTAGGSTTWASRDR